MNKLLILTAGSASLILAAGSALAAAPGGGGFGQYSSTGGGVVTGGSGTNTCITGATCQTLVSGAGFLQQEVTVTSGIGSTGANTYFRTIILDPSDGFSGTGFSNETFVGATSNSGNLASDGYVALGGTPGVATAGAGQTAYCTPALPCQSGATSGTGALAYSTIAGVVIPQNVTEAFIARGSLAQTTTGGIADIKSGAADPNGIKLIQTDNFLPDVTAAGTTNLEASVATAPSQVGVGDGNYAIPGEYTTGACSAAKPCADGVTTGYGVTIATTAGSAVGLQTNMEVTFEYLQDNGSDYMAVNEGRFAGTDPGTLTVREATGEFTPTAGTFTMPDGTTTAFNAGDDIQVSLLNNGVLGGGPYGYLLANNTTSNSGSAAGQVEALNFRDNTTGAIAQWVNDQHVQTPSNANDIGPAGTSYDPNDSGALAGATITGNVATAFVPLMSQPAASTLTTNLQWSSAYWNADFGNAPFVPTINGTGTALEALPTSMSAAFP